MQALARVGRVPKRARAASQLSAAERRRGAASRTIVAPPSLRGEKRVDLLISGEATGEAMRAARRRGTVTDATPNGVS